MTVRSIAGTLCLAWLAGLSGCAGYTRMAPEDREAVGRSVSGPDGDQFLKLSFHVTPFFGDQTKLLLTDVPPDEVRLLNDTRGAPINPGESQAVLPSGRRARILKVEFPTSWTVSDRLVYTPRTQPWVYLAVEGFSRTRPLILVLRPGLNSPSEFRDELARYLTAHEATDRLSELTVGAREAVEKKQILVDLPQTGLEMAWGYPERKRVSFDDGRRTEVWTWPSGKRTATLVDGRITAFTEP